MGKVENISVNDYRWNWCIVKNINTSVRLTNEKNKFKVGRGEGRWL